MAWVLSSSQLTRWTCRTSNFSWLLWKWGPVISISSLKIWMDLPKTAPKIHDSHSLIGAHEVLPAIFKQSCRIWSCPCESTNPCYWFIARWSALPPKKCSRWWRVFGTRGFFDGLINWLKFGWTSCGAPNLPGSFGVLRNISNFGATIDAEGVRGSALTTRALGI